MCIERNGRLRGVLNDYDMACIMDPGRRYPERGGNTLTGTRPFMALDLLDFHSEELRRWYRYDLESFAWCLTWMMLESHPSAWAGEDIQLLSTSKSAFISSIETRPLDIKCEWNPFGMFMVDWFSDWQSYYSKLRHAVALSLRNGRKTKVEKIAIRNVEDESIADLEYVRTVVENAVEVELDVDVEALRDISWTSVDLAVV